MHKNRTVALLSMRLILGLIFFFQGYGKVFTWGVENLYQMDFFYGTYKDLLPDFLIYGTAYYTSFVELIGGFLLLIGFKRDYALYALASVLVIVSFGHGLVEPIWDLSHVLYRTMLLVGLLLLPKEWDTWSLDHFFKR
ncbi:MAG: DoxX family protein [Saprospiraceae bacterium]